MQPLAKGKRLVEPWFIRVARHDAIIHDRKRMAATISSAAPGSGVKVTRLTAPGGPRPSWAIAVFAHNEGGRIRSALESIVSAAGGRNVEVVVLANGCADSTSDEVRACATVLTDLTLVEIDTADKANAWNVYVHDVITPERAAEIETCFFMDGDVTLEPVALNLLAAALQEHPSANAAGGMPATGRDRDAWRGRMVRNGTLAGNLYALRNRFVEAIRRSRIRMPIGLVHEDHLLSWLVATLSQSAGPANGPACIFCANAEFSFRSLSPYRLDDVKKYIKRKWRYTHSALQWEMLMHLVKKEGVAAMPADIKELYATAPLPSRLKWVGLDSPMRLLAVLQIRAHRK